MKCGLCVSECGNCGHGVRDDTASVRELLVSGRPVVAVLATEFVAALHPRSPEEVERVLEDAGFFAVESTLLGEELVALAYERDHTRPCAPLSLRSTCPVAVDWVRLFYPRLVSALVPVVPPYVAQARLVKAMYPEGTAVVYVSPCYARKDEAFDPQFEGAVDAVIDFTELGRLLQGAPPKTGRRTRAGSRRPQPVKEISLTDGFPRKTLAERTAIDETVVKVRGLRQLDDLLKAIMDGETAPAVIDMLNCEGCIDGPAVNSGMSVFAKRNIMAAERDSAPLSHATTREILDHMPTVSLLRSFRASPVDQVTPPAEEIDLILAEGEFETRDETLDCGACGYQTCEAHAVAIYHKNSSWDMCFPLQRRRCANVAEELERTATLDALTGLWNRRAFDDRIVEEVARALRYETPLSLLMIDIDGFKRVNDTYGHLAGDHVLKSVATSLCSDVRDVDIAVRYGGDEFALVLPATNKTAAFAVAEKLRESIARRPVPVNGDPPSISVTISIGVAALRVPDGTPLDLLEAADRALYVAKESGRDQVRLSAG